MNEVIDREISKLSLAERIQLVGDVWDAIARDSQNAVPLTAAQRDELEHRITLYEQNPAAGKSLNEILAKHHLAA